LQAGGASFASADEQEREERRAILAMTRAFRSRVRGRRAPDEATIGEIASEFGVSLRALRFYEARGLIRPRRSGARRFYGETQRRRLRTILSGKKFGFTLREIAELIAADTGEADLEDGLGAEKIVDQIVRLERRRDEIEAMIGRLRAAHETRRQAPSVVETLKELDGG
jgi:DNA-binding transcriptional MerR regulator